MTSQIACLSSSARSCPSRPSSTAITTKYYISKVTGRGPAPSPAPPAPAPSSDNSKKRAASHPRPGRTSGDAADAARGRGCRDLGGQDGGQGFHPVDQARAGAHDQTVGVDGPYGNPRQPRGHQFGLRAGIVETESARRHHHHFRPGGGDLGPAGGDRTPA